MRFIRLQIGALAALWNSNRAHCSGNQNSRLADMVGRRDGTFSSPICSTKTCGLVVADAKACAG